MHCDFSQVTNCSHCCQTVMHTEQESTESSGLSFVDPSPRSGSSMLPAVGKKLQQLNHYLPTTTAT